MPGPPVAKIISADCIKSVVSSREGTSIQPKMPSGAPALIAASRTILAAAIVEFLALGCGLIIIPFLWLVFFVFFFWCRETVFILYDVFVIKFNIF